MSNLSNLIDKATTAQESVKRKIEGLDEQRKALWIRADVDGENVDKELSELAQQEAKLRQAQLQNEAVRAELVRRQEAQRSAERQRQHDLDCDAMAQLNGQTSQLEKTFNKAAKEFFEASAALNRHAIAQRRTWNGISSYCGENEGAAFVKPNLPAGSVNVDFPEGHQYKNGHKFSSLDVSVTVRAGGHGVPSRSSAESAIKAAFNYA